MKPTEKDIKEAREQRLQDLLAAKKYIMEYFTPAELDDIETMGHAECMVNYINLLIEKGKLKYTYNRA